MGFSRTDAVDRVRGLVDTVETETMPVPVREVWVYGDLALGIDPVERLDVYLTKDILYGDDAEREAAFEERLGVAGIGRTVRADWAETQPDRVRADAHGNAAPAACLAAHLLEDGEPIHLEVCNASFEDNVTQRLAGARAHGDYEEVLDPRGACLWIDGRRSEDTFEKLRTGELVFPTLPEALEMLGMDAEEAATAAGAVRDYRDRQTGPTVRGDVV